MDIVSEAVEDVLWATVSFGLQEAYNEFKSTHGSTTHIRDFIYKSHRYDDIMGKPRPWYDTTLKCPCDPDDRFLELEYFLTCDAAGCTDLDTAMSIALAKPPRHGVSRALVRALGEYVQKYSCNTHFLKQIQNSSAIFFA